jgi:hypothetical protein
VSVRKPLASDDRGTFLRKSSPKIEPFQGLAR